MRRTDEHYIPSARDIATAVDGFCDPIIEFAGGVPRNRLADTLERYPDRGLYGFGERLILLGGLVLAATYVQSAITDRNVRGDHYRDFVSTILFRRGYHRGIACALFQKARQVIGGGISAMVGNDRIITAFAQARHRNAANTFRRRVMRPLETDVAAVVGELGFLRDVAFTPDGEMRVKGRPVQAWPFLHYDGKALLRIIGTKRFTQNGLPESIEWIDGAGAVPLVASLTFEQQSRLKKIGVLTGHPIRKRILRIDIPHTESVVPLLADTHPQMSDLAELLREKADDATIAEKWILPFLRSERGPEMTIDDALAEVSNTIVVDNAIIRRCLDTDPIAVLTEYLTREPGEELECLTRLSSPADAQKLYGDIQKRTARLRSRLLPMYPYEEHKALLENRVQEYRAGLAAREIARLLKFRIVDQHSHESIDDYIERVTAFAEYVDDAQADPAKIGYGLIKCGALVHDVLRFLIQFYTAVTCFDPTFEDGLGPRGRSALEKQLTSIRSLPFAKAIRTFHELGSDAKVQRHVREHLGRDLWDPQECVRFVEMLDEFRETYRNREAHEQSSVAAEADPRRHISNVLEFLTWLQKPTEDDAHRERIYPAVLHLNVITMNQCGITSVRYGLTERGKDTTKRTVAPITLYTQQPLAHLAGVFYGLPNQDKSQRGLWLDPILIPTSVFGRES